MTKNELRVLKFAIKYRGWHSYAKDAVTTRVIYKLSNLELLKVNRETRQFSLNRDD